MSLKFLSDVTLSNVNLRGLGRVTYICWDVGDGMTCERTRVKLFSTVYTVCDCNNGGFPESENNFQNDASKQLKTWLDNHMDKPKLSDLV